LRTQKKGGNTFLSFTFSYRLLRIGEEENNQSSGDEEPEAEEPDYNEPPKHYGGYDFDKPAKEVSPDWWEN